MPLVPSLATGVRPGPGHRRRRRHLATAAVVVVAAGLVVTRLGHGTWSGATGDALYAALVYVLVAFVAPRTRPRWVVVVAAGICTVVELAQLTGVPAAIVHDWWPARYVLGTTFQATDLLAYLTGALMAAGADRGFQRPRRDGASEPATART